MTAKAAPATHSVTTAYLDVVAVVVAAVPALVLGAPALGYLVGAGGWILSRVAQVTDRHFTARVSDPVRRAGANLFEAFGRIWLLAGAIVIAALVGGHRDGLTAAVVILVAYSIVFVIRLMSGPPPAREESVR